MKEYGQRIVGSGVIWLDRVLKMLVNQQGGVNIHGKRQDVER